jgi:hypothetical protein
MLVRSVVVVVWASDAVDRIAATLAVQIEIVVLRMAASMADPRLSVSGAERV